MNINYHSVNIETQKENYEVISAWLSQLPFESFFEDDKCLIGYYAEGEIEQTEIEECLENLKKQFDFKISFEAIENKNWNEEWEANFKPVIIDDAVCIRADFHPKREEVAFDIIINPKMAFGTAHHETTYMMMQEILKMDFKNKKVLDYGCGTSILAILAEKKGAHTIVANDYDINSVTNSQENIELNGSKEIQVLHGDLEVIKANNFDVIFANINRHVLLNNAQNLANKLKDGGVLLMSGILASDQEIILENYKELFSLIDQNQKGDWKCFLFIAR